MTALWNPFDCFLPIYDPAMPTLIATIHKVNAKHMALFSEVALFPPVALLALLFAGLWAGRGFREPPMFDVNGINTGICVRDIADELNV
jgi:hypothetical protein